MGVKIGWDSETKTVIRYDFSDPWSFDEFREAMELDDALFASVDHTVHLLFNMMEIHGAPPNMLAKLPQILNDINPRLGLVVIAGSYTWVQTIAEIFFKVYGRSIEGFSGLKVTRSLDDARRIIADCPA